MIDDRNESNVKMVPVGEIYRFPGRVGGVVIDPKGTTVITISPNGITVEPRGPATIQPSGLTITINGTTAKAASAAGFTITVPPRAPAGVIVAPKG